MNETILITGVTGFLGSHIFKFLVENTGYKVLGLKRPTSDLLRIKNYESSLIDLTPGYSNIDGIMKKYNVKAIIHCATNYGRGGISCAEVLDSNLIFPIKLIESAVENGVDLFINTDSYFNKENFSYMYLQNYSLSKKSLGLWLKYFANKIKVANVVLEHIYGENDSLSKFTSFLIHKIALEKTSEVELTSGDQKRDFIYIQDVVTAYKTILDFCLNNKMTYRNFEVGTGKALSIKHFAMAVKDISGSTTALNFGAIPYREDEIFISEAENSMLLNLGWKPQFFYKDGIREYIKNEQTIVNCNSNI